MFSLRKRAKVESQKVSSSNSTFDRTLEITLGHLPVEIYFCIFDWLDLRSLLKVRELNRSFKDLIDNAAFVWRRVRVNFDLERNEFDLNAALEMINRQSNVDSIDLNCPSLVPARFMTPRLTLDRNGHLFDLYVKRINFFSLGVLNYFSQNCANLEIRSVESASDEIKALKQLQDRLRDIKEFSNLESGVISFSGWNRHELDAFLKHEFRTIFGNAKTLTIRRYSASAKRLVKSLRKLKFLSSLNFDKCAPTTDYFEQSANSFAYLSTLSFNLSSNSSVFYFLGSLRSPYTIHTLKLFIDHTDYDQEDMYLLLMTKSVSKLENLKSLSSNIFHRYGHYSTICDQLGAISTSLNRLELVEAFGWNYKKQRSKYSNKFDVERLNTLFEHRSSQPNRVERLDVLVQLFIECSNAMSKLSRMVDLIKEKSLIFNEVEIQIICVNSCCAQDEKCEFDTYSTNTFVTFDEFIKRFKTSPPLKNYQVWPRVKVSILKHKIWFLILNNFLKNKFFLLFWIFWISIKNDKFLAFEWNDLLNSLLFRIHFKSKRCCIRLPKRPKLQTQGMINVRIRFVNASIGLSFSLGQVCRTWPNKLSLKERLKSDIFGKFWLKEKYFFEHEDRASMSFIIFYKLLGFQRTKWSFCSFKL